MRILIVEDDAPLAQGLAFHLKHAGFAADVCGDGPGGLEAASQGQYELILLARDSRGRVGGWTASSFFGVCGRGASPPLC